MTLNGKCLTASQKFTPLKMFNPTQYMEYMRKPGGITC